MGDVLTVGWLRGVGFVFFAVWIARWVCGLYSWFTLRLIVLVVIVLFLFVILLVL